MIRIVLLGRTGNILFQYALGRVLAEKHQVPLVLDGSWFNREGWAQVSHFLKLPLKARVVRRCSPGARALRKWAGRHYWEFRGVPVLRENPVDQSFDSGFLDAPSDCVLMGYFQTPLYFEAIVSELRDELNGLLGNYWMEGSGQDARATGARASCPHPSVTQTAATNPSIAEQIRCPESVAIHVRRTDYLKLPVFQVCGIDYFRRAMDQMRDWLGQPRFFVFSDDPEWCRNEFTERDQVVVDSATYADNPLHDMWLMSQASHHIICNSTYSWWAAWLGQKPNQRVIMPNRWYASEIKAPINEKRIAGWEVLR